MLPPLATNDLRDRRLRDAEELGEIDLPSSVRVSIANLFDDRRSESGVSVLLPGANRWWSISALVNAVANIVETSSDEEVIISNAISDVALVAEIHSTRDLAVIHLPSDPVRPPRSSVGVSEDSVSACLRTDPKPASGRLFDFCPETLLAGHACNITQEATL